MSEVEEDASRLLKEGRGAHPETSETRKRHPPAHHPPPRPIDASTHRPHTHHERGSRRMSTPNRHHDLPNEDDRTNNDEGKKRPSFRHPQLGGWNQPHSHRDDDEEEEEEEEEVFVSILGETTPGSNLNNLSPVLVVEKPRAGVATLLTNDGTVDLYYDEMQVGEQIKVNAVLEIVQGYMASEEGGNLVLRLEEPESEAIVVMGQKNDADDDTDELPEPPVPESGVSPTANVSALPRGYGVLVVRQDKCLLVRPLTSSSSGMATDEENRWMIPIGFASGDETDRNAALRAFQDSTEIDRDQILMLRDAAPVILYAPPQFNAVKGTVATIFLAYARHPPPSRPSASSTPVVVNRYKWFTYDEAMTTLSSSQECQCLEALQRSLARAVEAGAVALSFGDTPFGPAHSFPITVPSSLSSSGDQQHTLQRFSQLSALYHMKSAGTISQEEFDRLSSTVLLAQPPPTRTSNQRNATQPLPVTVLCGFLGAGKTTMLSHLIRNVPPRTRLALVVNDMAEINVDAELIRRETRVSVREGREERVVEMTNGCICCTLREDLLEQITEIAREGVYDYLIVESTGLGEPLPIAETFTFVPRGGGAAPLSTLARLDCVVTVVDASSLESRLGDHELCTLLTQQIEFADVLVINKSDLCEPSDLTRVQGTVRALNPVAKIVQTSNGVVSPEMVLNTKLFSFERAAHNAGWLKVARGQEQPETIEYGITSFVYRSERGEGELPLDAIRLWDLLSSSPLFAPSTLLRTKGVVHLTDERAVEWEGAGARHAFTLAAEWWCNVPDESKWPVAVDKTKMQHLPHTEVVLIGFFASNPGVIAEMTRALDACRTRIDRPSVRDLRSSWEEWSKAGKSTSGVIVVADFTA